MTQRFSADDFKEAPRSKRIRRDHQDERSGDGGKGLKREGCVPGKDGGEFNEEEWLEKRGKLEDLRKLQLLSMRWVGSN